MERMGLVRFFDCQSTGEKTKVKSRGRMCLVRFNFRFNFLFFPFQRQPLVGGEGVGDE